MLPPAPPESTPPESTAPESTPPQSAPLPFPIFLPLAGVRLVLLGGGEEIAAKLRLLAGSGATIEVFARSPCAGLAAAITASSARHHARAWAAGDFAAARLVFIGQDEPEPAAAARAAHAAGALVNAVDRPEFCDFLVPAIVDRAPLRIAIGSGGSAPALSRDLRARIEAAVPAAYGALAAFCRDWRARVAAALPDPDRRRRFWDGALAGRPAALALAGRSAAAGSELAAALATHQAAPARGRVSLVGAGPGDPDLLTLQGLRALQTADLVLHDCLPGPRVLELARRGARRIDVGKRCGRHAMSQAAITRLMVGHASRGAHVVRLKGGDPSIFARAGEEIAALEAAGVPFTVVPGITAACAAAARLALPLTDRALAHRLHFLTGHGESGPAEGEDWAELAARGGTLAIYMGARALPALAARMLAAGLSPATPAVAVENATLPGERRIEATLGTLAGALGACSGPALLLVGAVLARRVAVASARAVAA